MDVGSLSDTSLTPSISSLSVSSPLMLSHSRCSCPLALSFQLKVLLAPYCYLLKELAKIILVAQILKEHIGIPVSLSLCVCRDHVFAINLSASVEHIVPQQVSSPFSQLPVSVISNVFLSLRSVPWVRDVGIFTFIRLWGWTIQKSHFSNEQFSLWWL